MKKLLYFWIGIMVSISTQAQLQNLDFEQWDQPINTEIMSNIPTGWIWSNTSLTYPDHIFYHPPFTGAQNNDYALRLSVWYNYDKDAAIQHASIDSRPLSLTGFYTYEENRILGLNGRQTDTALVSVFLTKFNTSTQTSDTIGSGFFETGDNTSDYKQFTASIIYTNSAMPDSIIIVLDPSLCRRGGNGYQCEDAVASIFTVDNLVLGDGFTGLAMPDKNQTASVYPNPTIDFISIDPSMNEVVIRDITGKIIERVQPVSGNIDVQQLKPGTYLLEIVENNQYSRAKFIKL